MGAFAAFLGAVIGSMFDPIVWIIVIGATVFKIRGVKPLVVTGIIAAIITMIIVNMLSVGPSDIPYFMKNNASLIGRLASGALVGLIVGGFTSRNTKNKEKQNGDY